mgnify:CR=1 FL=1
MNLYTRTNTTHTARVWHDREYITSTTQTTEHSTSECKLSTTTEHTAIAEHVYKHSMSIERVWAQHEYNTVTVHNEHRTSASTTQPQNTEQARAQHEHNANYRTHHECDHSTTTENSAITEHSMSTERARTQHNHRTQYKYKTIVITTQPQNIAWTQNEREHSMSKTQSQTTTHRTSANTSQPQNTAWTQNERENSMSTTQTEHSTSTERSWGHHERENITNTASVSKTQEWVQHEYNKTTSLPRHDRDHNTSTPTNTSRVYDGKPLADDTLTGTNTHSKTKQILTAKWKIKNSSKNKMQKNIKTKTNKKQNTKTKKTNNKNKQRIIHTSFDTLLTPCDNGNSSHVHLYFFLYVFWKPMINMIGLER